MIADSVARTRPAPGLHRWLYLGLVVGIAFTMLPVADAQNPSPRERAPERIYRDFFARCDTEGPPGAVSHDWAAVGAIFGDIPRPFTSYYLRVFSSIVRGIDGTSGNRTWARDLGNWHKLPGPEVTNADWYLAPIREGWPDPYYPFAPIDNLQPAGDLNNDGSCDFIGYGWQFTGAAQQVFNVDLRAIDGYTGKDIWVESFVANRIQSDVVYIATNFPTGMYYYDSPTGPRLAWKTTDVVFDYQSQVWSVLTEHIQVRDPTEEGDGDVIWETTVLNPHYSATSTFFTGAGQLDAEPDFELVIDQFNRVPFGGDEFDGDGRGPPRILNATAFKGVPELAVDLPTERVLWGPSPYYKPPQRGNDARQGNEEPCEYFVWTHAYLTSDFALEDPDDRTAEFVGFYLTDVDRNAAGENCETSSQSGRFKTHFNPLSGATGRMIWPKVDFKQQGWGFPSDLNLPWAYHYESWGSLPTLEDPEVTHPFLGIGTVDLPQPVPRGGRFPPKNVRLSTLKAEDATPIWGTFSAPFGTDSNLAADWALKQYAQTLAPDDYTGDGVRDLISAGQYDPPQDKVQTLMSTTHHRFDVLDSRKGKLVERYEPWGPKGMVVYCHEDGPADVTFLTGHTRRLDLTRVNAITTNQTWRNNLYVNAKAQAQTAGNDMVFFGHRCVDTRDTRTFFGSDPGLLSYRRGFEILPIYGYFEEWGPIDWLLPDVQYKAPFGATLDPFLDISEPPPTLKETIGMTTFSVASGIGAAFGAVTLFNRSRRPGGA